MRRFFDVTLLQRNAVFTALAGLLLAALCGWQGLRFFQRSNPLLTTPQLALATLGAEKLYFNGPARPWLLAQRPELLTPEDRDDRSERTRSFAQAVANPQLFRQLDRQIRFNTLLLVGDPSQYRALLEHLVETKDFLLVYADHTSLIFQRDHAVSWTLETLAPVRAKFAQAPPGERATFLAQTGIKLLAAQRAPEGRALLDEALALDPKTPDAWNGLASYFLNRGDWQQALTHAEQALALDKNHLGALATETQLFYATKRFNEAYALSQRVLERLPDDPNVLFKHAQIAHEAHAYKAEIRVLKQLISLAEASQRPTTGYWLYLAQAYAAASQAQPAIEAFTQVLADPNLPPDQRTFATENLERIKQRSGL